MADLTEWGSGRKTLVCSCSQDLGDNEAISEWVAWIPTSVHIRINSVAIDVAQCEHTLT